jgi:hypothetical protein
VLARTFPEAPVFAILYSSETGPASLAQRIVSSSLGRVPGAARRHRWLLPWFPGAVQSFDLSAYDVIISSHHTAAKGLLRNALQFHLCYCHTPMLALWERPAAEVRAVPAPARPFASRALRDLRAWGLATVQRVGAFVANSETTRRRIAAHYGRESTVLYPPIDTSRVSPAYGQHVGQSGAVGEAAAADLVKCKFKRVARRTSMLGWAATTILASRPAKIIVAGHSGPRREACGIARLAASRSRKRPGRLHAPYYPSKARMHGLQRS